MLSAQDYLGLKNNLLGFRKANNIIKDDNGNIQTDDVRTGLDFDFDLFYINQHKKFNMIYQVGYRRFYEKNKTIEIEEGVADQTVRSRIIEQYAMSIGIEKEIKWQSLVLFYGAELPFVYQPKRKEYFDSDILDQSTNQKIGSFETITKRPQAFATGLNLNIRLYHFFGRFGVGLEITNGFRLDKPSKNIENTLNVYNLDGSLNYSVQQNRTEKRLTISQNSYFSIGFRYKLSKE